MFGIEFTYNPDQDALAQYVIQIKNEDEIFDKYFTTTAYVPRTSGWNKHTLKINKKCKIYQKTVIGHKHTQGTCVTDKQSIDILKEEIKKAHNKQFNTALQRIIND